MKKETNDLDNTLKELLEWEDYFNSKEYLENVEILDPTKKNKVIDDK